MFYGKGINKECGLFPDEWRLPLGDVIPDVSQYDVHFVQLGNRKKFHDLFDGRWKNRRYGKDVSEKTEKDGTVDGKLDHAKRICRGIPDTWFCRDCRSWLRLRVGGD
jgi:hypothetical protein